MAKRKSVFGACHLCGDVGKLSFEHVPPRATFKAGSIMQDRGLEMFEEQNVDKIKGKINQRGAGGYTLRELAARTYPKPLNL